MMKNPIRTFIRSHILPAIQTLRLKLRSILLGKIPTVEPQHQFAIAEIEIRGIPHSMALRMASSDARTMASCLLDLQYDFDLGFEPETILDLGGNIGCSAIYFANRWPNARIFVVEPFAENFNLLMRNIAPYPNVKAICAAAHHINESVHLKLPDSGFWGVHVAADNNRANSADSATEAIRGMRVEELMAAAGFDAIDLLKIDIEGSEADLFRHDASVWLNKTKVLIVELHDWIRAGSSWNFEKALAPYESRRIVIGENIAVWLEHEKPHGNSSP